MQGYSNEELFLRIIITFFESFIASFVTAYQSNEDNSIEGLRIVVIVSICCGISGIINLLKMLLEERKINNENKQTKIEE